MSRSVFGWSYPPGAANDPNAPYNQDDPPCAVCGAFVDDCICPECVVCGAVGDPVCYDGDTVDNCYTCRHEPQFKHVHRLPHGLVRSAAQTEQKAKLDDQWKGFCDG